MNDELDIFDDDWFDDEFDDTDDLYSCGMGPDGFCSLAGTEYCDWDCPFMNGM